MLTREGGNLRLFNMYVARAIRAKTHDSRSLFCKLFRNIGVGRFVFRISVLLFKIENLLGHYNQRFIEYPWVLHQLESAQGRILLDVGCSGSLLDHELLARGFRVVGLGIQDVHEGKDYENISYGRRGIFRSAYG